MTATAEPAPPEPIRRFSPGDVLGSRYRLASVVARGDTATVWRAEDEVLERPVAVKVTSGDGFRFVNEARTAASVSHVNLVQIFDYGAAAGRRYLVMEFVDGETLAERLRHGPMSAAEAHELACGLLAGLGCVHRAGLLHGAISADTVLCGSDGRARLTGVGIAGRQAGEPAAPREPESRRADLYALGLVLAEIPIADEPDPAFTYTVARLTRPRPDQRPLDAEDALRSLRCQAAETGQDTQEFDVLAVELGAGPAAAPTPIPELGPINALAPAAASELVPAAASELVPGAVSGLAPAAAPARARRRWWRGSRGDRAPA